jgi:WD40 repeat protein
VLTVSGKKVKGAEITKRGTSAAIWDVRSGKKVANLPGTDGEIKKALFSPDGSKVLTIADNFSAIWDAQTGDQLKSLRPEYTVLDAAFSPKGDRFATACNDTGVRIYDLETGQSIDPLAGHDNPVLSVAFSPDGTRIASGSSDGTARIWDAETGSAIHVLKGQERWVVDVKFSADGQYLLTQALDGIRVWDAASGETVTLLAERNNVEDGLALIFLNPPPKFSPDSRHIVRSYRDVAHVLDIPTGKLVAAFDGHDAEFSPDGRYLVAASGNTARIWRLFESNQQEVDEGKSLVSRCLSGSERQAAFLDPQPPAWCIETEKWPYQTQDWKDWLQFQRANANPPLPSTAEWPAWREAHK